jgi:hypothetical protein
LDDPDQAGAVGEIAVVELEADIGFMQVAVEMVDAPGVENRGASFDAVDFIALSQQQFGEIGAVLSGHAGHQCDLVGHGLFATGDAVLRPRSAAVL